MSEEFRPSVRFRMAIEEDWRDGEWFTCPTKGFTWLEVKIKHWTAGDADATNEKCTLTRVVGGKRESERDDDAFTEAMIDGVIQDLRDAESHESVPCTLNTKLAIAHNHRPVIKWIMETALDHERMVQARSESASAEKKISGTGSQPS